MAVNPNVQRLALQKTRVTEVHLPPLPEPPAALMRIPGVMDWWKEMKVTRERDQEALYKALLTKATGDETIVTNDQLTSCCDTLSAALALETANRAAQDDAINNSVSVLSNAVSVADAALSVRIDGAGAGDDTLAWMNL